MKRKRYTDEQIAYALRQAEAGTPIKEVCRKLGVSEQTFYTWRRKFAGMGVAELWELRQLRHENGEVEAAGGRSEPGQAHAPGGAIKKGLKPARKRKVVRYLQEGFRISERRACRLTQFSRSRPGITAGSAR